MSQGFDHLINEIILDKQEISNLSKIYAHNLSSLMACYLKSDGSLLAKPKGISYGLLASAEAYRRIAANLAKLPFGYAEKQRNQAVSNMVRFAECIEFSHHIEKNIWSRLSNQPKPDEQMFSAAAEPASSRLNILKQSLKDSGMNQESASISRISLDETVNRQHPFYDKTSAKILVNGMLYCLIGIKEPDLDLSDPQKGDDIAKIVSEVSRDYSCVHGLKLASGMYSQLAELFSKYPEFAFITEDKSPEEAAKTAKTLSHIFSYSRRLADSFVQNSKSAIKDIKSPADVLDLNFAEEIGPSHIRRRIMSYAGEIPKEIDDVLRSVYENETFENVQNRIVKYTASDYFADSKSRIKFMKDFLGSVKPIVESAEKSLSEMPDGQITISDVKKFLEENKKEKED